MQHKGSAAVKHAEQVYFRSVTNYPSEYTTAEESCFMSGGTPKIIWWSALWSQITLNAAVHVKQYAPAQSKDVHSASICIESPPDKRVK